MMKDIHGNIIEPGDTVKTQQHPGGILPPAPPTIGKVIKSTNPNTGKDYLLLEYFKEGSSQARFIALEGKINEILLD
jgi:hypothetical protein